MLKVVFDMITIVMVMFLIVVLVLQDFKHRLVIMVVVGHIMVKEVAIYKPKVVEQLMVVVMECKVVVVVRGDRFMVVGKP
jgi:hypothetical protein